MHTKSKLLRLEQSDQGPKLSFFMLTSAKHEILNAHKCKNTKIFGFFSGLDKPGILFFLFTKVEMPTIVSISTFMSRKI